MATLVLASAGAAIGGALMPAGVSFLGTALSGAVIGRAVGATVGRYIDEALFGASGQTRIVDNTGSRLADLQVTSSSEGAPLPRIYGRARLGGQLIWATNFEEEVVRDTTTSGGGKGLGAPKQTTVTINYRYYASFAVALCEGPITRLGRVWADGKELNIASYGYRFYRGEETQQPDSLIEAKQGAGRAPAYRGVAYVVFERMPLGDFGNRIPQLNFEVFRALDDVEQMITGVGLIPASGEFVYETTPVERDAGHGATRSENIHQLAGGTDFGQSLDQLADTLPNCRAVSLFVAWFGDDLRAGHCRVRPGVETRDKSTSPYEWRVAGQSRDGAHLVSAIDDVPAYGGTPADRAVVSAIRELKARGFRVTLNPFLLMDVPAANSLPDPYGRTQQPAFPWRGRITCHPAAGVAGSPDRTPAAAAQIAAFVGSCTVGDFALSNGEVAYSGQAEWSWRRMVLHYAHLCQLAGGVDAFLIGSELRGLSTVRSGAAAYPFVAALVQLAADVKAVLGPPPVSAMLPTGRSISAISPRTARATSVFTSIRCGRAARSMRSPSTATGRWPTGATTTLISTVRRVVLSIYDRSYLRRNLAGGEGFDWYYASDEDRARQVRTPITDGAGKPWVFRYKDIENWWRNRHYDRPGGIELTTPTSWQPQSKPFWLMEVGCPAIDKGANQPNVFHDPKSAESALPHFSRGSRDDTIQRRYLQAVYDRYSPGSREFSESDNPLSPVFGGRMVDPAMIHAYCWDARPYPAFPYDSETWADSGNWHLGHWLNGRMGGGPLGAVVRGILDSFGFAACDVSGIDGTMEGYVLDRTMSARDALQPLEMAFFLDSFESEGRIRFVHKGNAGVVATLTPGDLVDTGRDRDAFALTRSQETDLPRANKLTYIDSIGDYRQAVVEARRAAGASSRVAAAQLPIVLGQQQAQGIAESWLHDVWAGRERAAFALPASKLALEPGDVVRLATGARDLDLRVTAVRTNDAIEFDALTLQSHIYCAPAAPQRVMTPRPARVFGPSLALFLDLPLLRGEENPADGYVVAHQSPWPGAVAFCRSSGPAAFSLAAFAEIPAVIGETLTPLAAGPVSRWDRASRLDVLVYGGQLTSRDPLDVFAGGNLAALETPGGRLEVIQFETAALIGASTYRLSGLLRGQGGTEPHMAATLAAGARFVLIDRAVTRVPQTLDEVGLAFNWKIGPAVYDIGHRSYRDAVRAFQGLALKPFSPVHVRARRELSGDVRFIWVRRTRQGGDSWQASEVLLAEDSERYEVDILGAGGAVQRMLAVPMAEAVYPAAAQLEDFGQLPARLDIAVQQLSAVSGRGHAAHAGFDL